MPLRREGGRHHHHPQTTETLARNSRAQQFNHWNKISQRQRVCVCTGNGLLANSRYTPREIERERESRRAYILLLNSCHPQIIHLVHARLLLAARTHAVCVSLCVRTLSPTESSSSPLVLPLLFIRPCMRSCCKMYITDYEVLAKYSHFTHNKGL